MVEAVSVMLIPGSDQEKEYLNYLLNKYHKKKIHDKKTTSNTTNE